MHHLPLDHELAGDAIAFCVLGDGQAVAEDHLGASREDEDMRAFFLTDYLAQHFDKLIWEGFGIDRHPDMVEFVFGNYEKVVYLAQAPTDALKEKAKAAADKLGLAYEYRETGYGDLADFMASAQ